MARKIQLKRGLESDLPRLDVGEPGFTTDTEKFFVGGNTGNVEIVKMGDINGLAGRVDGHDTDIAATNALLADKAQQLKGYLTPEQYGYVDGSSDTNANLTAVDNWISAVRTNGVMAKAHNLTLYKDISLKGLRVEITGNLNVQSYKLEIGGSSSTLANPHQYIEKITKTSDVAGIYIRGAYGQHIKLSYCFVNLYLRLNNTDTAIAYSKFDLGYCPSISIGNDTGVNTSVNLWCNENEFYLQNTQSFTISGSYSHNNNRVYGGCFEGNTSTTFINVDIGNSNYFYDCRFEGNGKVIFGTKAANNVVFTSYQVPNLGTGNVQVIENGYMNSIRYNLFKDSNKVYSGQCSAFNLNDSHFQCILNADPNFIQPKNVATGTSDTKKIVFQSDFMENPRGLAFVAKINAKTGNGVNIGYNIYDANFNLITTYNSTGLYVVTNVGTGYSLTPNVYLNMASDPGYAFYQMIPSGNIATTDTTNTIKYVKFFLYSTTDNTNVWANVKVDIYDLGKSQMSA